MKQARNRPTATEFVEFAKRSGMFNLDTPVEKLLDAAGVVGDSMGPGAAAGGYIIVNEHYAVWTGVTEELADPAIQAPVRTRGIEG